MNSPANTITGRILLVEDDPGLAMLLASLLTEAGHLCDTADTGVLALQLRSAPLAAMYWIRCGLPCTLVITFLFIWPWLTV